MTKKMVKLFSISVVLVETKEVFTVPNVSSSTTVANLKLHLELIAGIPTHLQRIMYLDEGDMEDSSTLRHHDVVNGARLTMCIWKSWASLVEACVEGNISKVMNLGVTPESTYRNPNIDRMTTEARNEYFQSRSAIALFIASHRGHLNLIKALIDTGVRISATTKQGRNALHVAAANGQTESIELLLASGAGRFASDTDKHGQTPLQAAVAASHKFAARELFLYQWRRRASKMQKLSPADHKHLMAHQLYDSSSRTWLTGEQLQHYQSQILPPQVGQEFQGSGIGAKKSDWSLKLSESLISSMKSDEMQEEPGTSGSTAKHGKEAASKSTVGKVSSTQHRNSKTKKSLPVSRSSNKNKLHI